MSSAVLVPCRPTFTPQSSAASARPTIACVVRAQNMRCRTAMPRWIPPPYRRSRCPSASRNLGKQWSVPEFGDHKRRSTLGHHLAAATAKGQGSTLKQVQTSAWAAARRPVLMQVRSAEHCALASAHASTEFHILRRMGRSSTLVFTKRVPRGIRVEWLDLTAGAAQPVTPSAEGQQQQLDSGQQQGAPAAPVVPLDDKPEEPVLFEAGDAGCVSGSGQQCALPMVIRRPCPRPARVST